MSNWDYTLRLGDMFHDENMSFEQRRDEIVRRIRASRFWDEDDGELVTTVSDLSAAWDVDEFDQFWDKFYDWADWNRVWVETFS